jgi:hypothetical protein
MHGCYTRFSMEWKQQYLGSHERPYNDGELEMSLVLVEKYVTPDSGQCLRFRDDAGHCIVWFTRNKSVVFDIGANVRARFTVKSHHCYNGVWESVTKGFKLLGVDDAHTIRS